MRVNRHLAPPGQLLLDAGSGPVQWPEYLTYSAGYRHRVCVDISITALRAAQEKLGPHGLCVVADIASLPFEADAFDGVVSIHAIHHLPAERACQGVPGTRCVSLRPGRSAVAINGWYRPLLMRLAEPLIGLGRLLSGRRSKEQETGWRRAQAQRKYVRPEDDTGAASIRVDGRSALRGVRLEEPQPPIHAVVCSGAIRGPACLLRLVFRLEEMFPRFFGLHGQYPMIVLRKPAVAGEAAS